MQTHDIAPHLETLTRALGDKIGTEVSEEDLRDEFAKYLEYGVPVDQAIRTILRHHGVQQGGTAPAAPTSQERIPIAELPPTSPYVHVKARLLSMNTKEVNARGETKEIYWGLLGDESGTIAYTSWRPLEGLSKGDVLEVEGAYTKEWNGQAQLNLGDRTKITRLEGEEMPTPPQAWQDARIGDIREGMRGLAVTGRILSIAPREITLRTGEQKTLWSGKLADESGSIEFTSWHDHNLREGQAVRIEGAYVRAFRGVPQINFDADAKITSPEANLPDATTLAATATIGIDDLVARNGGNDITVVATLLEVRPGSGLIFRDKETNRVVHGPQTKDGVPDLRIKAVLDDGTGAVNMVANRQLTEQLLGKTLEQCQEEARAAFRHEVVQEQLEEKLTSRVYRVNGNALSDEYGIMLIAQSITSHEEDTKARATALLADMEAS